MTIVLDSGALIASERNDVRLTTILQAARKRRKAIVVPTTVIAETWRGSPGNARAAKLLKYIDDILPLDFDRARRIGCILGRAGSASIVDGSVVEVAIARRPAAIVTADPDDIVRLLEAEGVSFARMGGAGERRADVLVITMS